MPDLPENTSQKAVANKAMTLRLVPSTAAELETVARAEGLTISEAVRTAINEYIERRRSDPGFKSRLRRMLDTDRDVIARFLGAGNILRGEVRGGLLDPGDGVKVPVDGPDGPAAFVIRPEDVRLDPDAPLRGTVVEVVDAGTHVRVSVRSGDRLYEAHLPAGTSISTGEETGLVLPRERLWRLPEDDAGGAGRGAETRQPRP